MAGRSSRLLARLLGIRERWRDLHLELARAARRTAELDLRLMLLGSRVEGSELWRGAEHAHAILRSLQPTGSSHEFRRIGSAHDGGYVLAADLSLPETVMSIGVGSNDFADRELADGGCFVHQFDHTIEAAPGIAHPRIMFHRLGIGGADCLHPLRPLAGLEAEAGGIADGWLMMDVEGAEWGVLCDESASLASYSQISIELHGLLGLLRADVREYMGRALARLTQDHVVVAHHVNNFSPDVHAGSMSFPDVIELTLVRMDIFRPGSSLPDQRLFAPNNPASPSFGNRNHEAEALTTCLSRLSPFIPRIPDATIR